MVAVKPLSSVVCHRKAVHRVRRPVLPSTRRASTSHAPAATRALAPWRACMCMRSPCSTTPCGAGPRLDIVWPDQPGEVEQGLRMYMHARQGAEPQGHGSRRGHGRSRAAGQHGFQAVRRTALRCTALLVRRQTGRQTVSLPCFYPNFKSMPKSLSGRRALHMRAEPVKRG